MRHPLYSELRTIYETTAEDPHTFRLSLKLKDLIDGDMLREAVAKTMERYPYFCMRMVVEGPDVYFEDNPLPVPVIETNGRITLGSESTNYHLMCFCYWQNWLHVEVHHSLTDGGGVHPVIGTLLNLYLSAFYEIDLDATGLRMPGDEINLAEWEDPAREALSPEHEGLARKWSGPAFQIHEEHVGLLPDSIVTTVGIDEKEFIPFSISNDGSPATVVALLLARSFDMVHEIGDDPIVIALCVNQRRALKAPLAHQSLVGDARLVYSDRLRSMPFMDQVTCFRGMTALQTDDDMVLDDIRDYQRLMRELEEIDTFEGRHELCVRNMQELSKSITATVSYIGRVSMGPMERFLQEFDPLPSTALPSMHTPVTIEMVSMNGSIVLNFIQYFSETTYFSNFVRQLWDNDINYNVLRQERARYPRMEIPGHV